MAHGRLYPYRYYPKSGDLQRLAAAGLSGSPLQVTVRGVRRGSRGLVHGDASCRRIPHGDRGQLPVVELSLGDLGAGLLPDPCADCFRGLLEGSSGALAHLRVGVALLELQLAVAAEPQPPAADPVACGNTVAWLDERLAELRALEVVVELVDAIGELTAFCLARRAQLVAAVHAATGTPAAAHLAALAWVRAHAAWQSNQDDLLHRGAGGQGSRTTLLGPRAEVAATLAGLTADVWCKLVGDLAGANERLGDAGVFAADSLCGAHRSVGEREFSSDLLAGLAPTLDSRDYLDLHTYARAELAAAQDIWSATLVAGWSAHYRRAVRAAAGARSVVACWQLRYTEETLSGVAALWGHLVPSRQLPEFSEPTHVAVLPLSAVLWLHARPGGWGPLRPTILGWADEDSSDVLDLAVRLHLEAVNQDAQDAHRSRFGDQATFAAPSLRVRDSGALIAARGILAVTPPATAPAGR